MKAFLFLLVLVGCSSEVSFSDDESEAEELVHVSYAGTTIAPGETKQIEVECSFGQPLDGACGISVEEHVWTDDVDVDEPVYVDGLLVAWRCSMTNTSTVEMKLSVAISCTCDGNEELCELAK